jgi:hypothetical protein
MSPPQTHTSAGPMSSQQTRASEGPTSSQQISGSQASKSSSTGENSEYTKEEPFEAFKVKVVKLCREIGWGEPSSVARVYGGSYNRIVGLMFIERKPSEYILRVPKYELGATDDLSLDVKDQVALLEYLSSRLPVATVCAFDTTQKNALCSPYVLQQRISGQTMDPYYYRLPLGEKLQITTVVAETMKRMELVKFESAGRLSAVEDFPHVSHEQFSVDQTVQVCGFRRSRYLPGSDLPQTGITHVAELLHTLFEYRKKKDEDWMEDTWTELQNIALQMERVGMTRSTDNECVMWHWDFAPRNIMMCSTSTASESPKHERPANITFGDPSCLLGKEDAQVTVDDSSITTYMYTMDIEVEYKGGDSEAKLNAIPLKAPSFEKSINTNADLSSRVWDISGILDLDLITSVPLVLARQPPLWLWCDEFERTPGYDGNPDIPPARAFTQDEQLIKAHFDKIMEEYDPSYIEDAYQRGPWLRGLAKYALYGFGCYGSREGLEDFKKEWREFYDKILQTAGATSSVGVDQEDGDVNEEENSNDSNESEDQRDESDFGPTSEECSDAESGKFYASL